MSTGWPAPALVEVLASKTRPKAQRFPAVSVLTVLMALAFLIPARFTFQPLGGAGRLDVILGLGLFVWWLVTRTVPALTVRRSQPLRIVLFVLLATMFVAAAFAFQRGLTATEFAGMELSLLGWVSTAGVLLVTLDGIQSYDELDRLLKRMVLLGVAMAGVAVLQFFVGFDLTPHLQPPGLSLNLDLRAVENRSVVARVFGTSFHPIEFGVLMAGMGAIATHLALMATGPRERQLRWAAAALIMGSALLSVSRSAVVGLGVILLGFLLIWRPRMWLNALAISFVGLAFMRALAPGLLGTLRALFEHLSEDPSISGRTNDYGVVFGVIEDSFWWGLGPGTFNSSEYIILDNQWLVQLASTGVVVTMMLAALLVGGIAQAQHVLFRGRTDEARHLGHTLSLVLVVFVITSFFFDSLAFPQIRVFTTIVLGCAGALWSLERERAVHVTRDTRRIMRIARTVEGADRPRRLRAGVGDDPTPVNPGASSA